MGPVFFGQLLERAVGGRGGGCPAKSLELQTPTCSGRTLTPWRQCPGTPACPRHAGDKLQPFKGPAGELQGSPRSPVDGDLGVTDKGLLLSHRNEHGGFACLGGPGKQQGPVAAVSPEHPELGGPELLC